MVAALSPLISYAMPRVMARAPAVLNLTLDTSFHRLCGLLQETVNCSVHGGSVQHPGRRETSGPFV